MAKILFLYHGVYGHTLKISGVLDRVEVGTAPWGVVLGRGTRESGSNRAYVSTAEGIAVVDTTARRLVTRVPYLAAVGPPGFGEYRAGGMGLALSPDGTRLYVGINLPGGNGRLEVLDTAQLRIVGGATVGVRPFDVVASRDGRHVYSIDHDSFSVTIVETATLATRTVALTPAGRDAFAKPHYGAIGPDDRLLLPIMGRVLVSLGPDGGTTLAPLTANTHQHHQHGRWPPADRRHRPRRWRDRPREPDHRRSGDRGRDDPAPGPRA